MRLHKSKRCTPMCRGSAFAVPAWFSRTAAGVLVIVIGLLAGLAHATDYYVATNGSDTGAGTLASPYQTIQKAANVAQAGDNVYVRGGTYRETVSVAHSGSSGSPITFQPYGNEPVTVTGLDTVNSSWSPYSGSIYSTSLSGGASQLFVNGQMMTEARWPDTKAGSLYYAMNNPLYATNASISTVSMQSPPTLSTITSSTLAGTPDGTWTGATLAVTSGQYQWSVLARTIQNQTGSTLQYTAGADEANWPTFYPQVGNHYYITGSLAALTVPKEYYYDSAASKLYLQAPGNANPSSQVVEARKRQLGFDLGSQSYVTVQGFTLKAASINVAGNYNVINNCQIIYPTPYTAPTSWHNGAAGVQIGGRYNTICNSEVGYSWGDGVTITNSNNTVNNNVIHDVDWAGNDGSFVSTSNSGGYNTITNNTMYNAGRSGVLLNNVGFCTNDNTVIEHNNISRYGILTCDLGGIYAYNTDLPGSTIAYNHIDGNSAFGTLNAGVYLDDSTNGATVHHNLITNSDIGIYVKGRSQNIYNNTLWGINGSAVYWGSGGYTNINTVNNLSNVSTFQGTTVTTNRYQTANQFNNSAAGDYTLAANSSGTNMGPTYKRAVGYGTPISGITPDGNPTPDAGAFQTGVTPWTSGASFHTWTAGNQLSAALASALYVTQSGSRVTTGSLLVGNTGSTSANNRSFLQFDLSGVVATTIKSAILRIYENTTPTSAAGSVTLNRVTSAWTSSTVTYGQSVDTTTPITGFYDPSNLGLYTDIDISSWVQGWLSNPSTNYGLCLSGTEGIAGTAKYFDGFSGVTAPQLVVTMPEPGDANLDGRVDVSDLAILAANYRKHVTGGWTQADFNNDGVVDVKDLAVLAANYRYGVASDVVPVYNGLDTEAIELLSLAGVIVAPEPGALVLFSSGLLGLMAYAWRKWLAGYCIVS